MPSAQYDQEIIAASSKEAKSYRSNYQSVHLAFPWHGDAVLQAKSFTSWYQEHISTQQSAQVILEVRNPLFTPLTQDGC
jgi:hypothetical protein